MEAFHFTISTPVYYLLQDYNHALKYVNALLLIEPSNHQAQDLKRYINKKMKSGKKSKTLHIDFQNPR